MQSISVFLDITKVADCRGLKTTFEIPLTLITEMREQIAAFGFNKYGLHISSLSNR